MSRPLAIYAGYIVRYPLGGHILSELHSLVGLQQLGYDVIFAEESGGAWAPCYDPVRNTMTSDASHGINVLKQLLRPHELDDNWCYVDAHGTYLGLAAQEFRDRCRNATLLLSRAGVTWLEEFRECKTRVYLDMDPGFTQFRACEVSASCPGFASPHDFHHHFTIGERIGRADCSVPDCGLNWRPSRQPVVLDLITPRFTPEAKLFTTVMNWSAYGATEYRGETYGQKDVELLKLLDLPQRTGPVFEIALAGPNAPADKLRAAGWIVSDPLRATESVKTYCDFIGRSRGEFSVAKNCYVKTRSGWFSDRTANYLAMGKPAIVQDTGFSENLPCGEGLFAFRSADDVLAAIETIAKDYARHCRAARKIAEDYFDARKTLGALLRQCDLPVAD
jgi:hypothetical protein